MSGILLVDDDPLVRSHVGGMLERAGYQVIEAQDGLEGLEKYERHRPDLVVMDVIMPGQEGVETISKIRQLSADVPIIAMSSGGPEASNLFLQLAQGVGANRTLRKPFQQDDLLKLVGACLNGADARPTK